MSHVTGLEKQILDLLGQRHIRLTPSSLEQEICHSNAQASRKMVRSVIKKMVAEGVLLYTNHFNTTHLELNFNRPNQLSERISLIPGIRTCQTKSSNSFCIRLDQGSSFGSGDHPTTRLSLRGLDYVMQLACRSELKGEFQALDIGTGSGVLAIAAIGLGASSAVGLDIDPIALYEAARNIALNEMGQKIELTSDPMEGLPDSRFSLVMANLRPPTLKRLMPAIVAKSTHRAYWVFSGCRQEALDSVFAILPGPAAKIIWQECSCGWAALAIRYAAL